MLRVDSEGISSSKCTKSNVFSVPKEKVIPNPFHNIGSSQTMVTKSRNAKAHT